MKNEEELENPGLTFANSIVNIDAEELMNGVNL